MTERVGCAVVGAGVVGLAVARALSRAGHEVLVLEEAGAIGTGASSRNSEVIHAGLYYTPGSVRAQLCAPGRRALYAYCAAHGVAARACGKLIVATEPEELGALDAIAARGAANGVEGLRRLSAVEARLLEPALRCTGALLSPRTSIVDSHALMLSLRGEAEDYGAMFAFHAPVVRAEGVMDGFLVDVAGATPLRIHANMLVNAAGLGACALAARIAGLEAQHVPPAYLAKGSYFALAGPAPFRHLIYPVPIPGGAGIHLTLDLAGAPRFGPDVEPVDRLDYTVDPARAAGFEAAIRRYWPGLPANSLVPAYAGIRPKIVPPTEVQDFVIQGPAVHGVPGLVNLFGIESPGLTSCLAIGDAVREMLA